MIATFVGIVLVTQLGGWSPTVAVVVVQSVTPYVGLLLVPVALVAIWRRWLFLATPCAAIGMGLLVLAAPLAFPDDQPDPIEGAVGLRVASANLLYSNERMDDVVATLHDLAPDVIVFNEYTPQHQATLQASPLADDYPYGVDRTDEYAGGIALWSREPVEVDTPPDTHNHSLDVRVDGPDGEVRVVALHVPAPMISFTGWKRDLRTAARLGRDATTPTMIVGDLNASYWHPDFRQLLDVGAVDAHIANDHGFGISWPTDSALPPFVRLDHALTTDGLVSVDAGDFEIPGSDHRGLIVTVAPTQRATP